MKFMVMIYNDKSLVDALPEGELDSRLNHCFAYADDLKRQGKLLDSQMLEEPSAAKSLRVRDGRRMTLDGPFAETKEMIAGINVIEAQDMDEAVRIASEFPWSKTGCVEVRPIRDLDAVRERVGAGASELRAPKKANA
jgi:hypothetical protein